MIFQNAICNINFYKFDLIKSFSMVTSLKMNLQPQTTFILLILQNFILLPDIFVNEELLSNAIKVRRSQKYFITNFKVRQMNICGNF